MEKLKDINGMDLTEWIDIHKYCQTERIEIPYNSSQVQNTGNVAGVALVCRSCTDTFVLGHVPDGRFYTNV